MWTDKIISRIDPQCELKPGAFALADLIIHNGSVAVGIGPIEITTPREQWAFAAAFPIRMNASDLNENIESLLIRVEANIKSGRIGVGCATRDLQSYTAREVERSAGDDRTTFDIILPAGKDCGFLVVRNTAEGGVPSRVIVHNIRTFKIEAPPSSALPMTYIFEHIFKTGGTTFNLSYLLGAFPQEEVVIVRGFRDTNREDLERLMALPEGEKRRIKVIAGHNTGRLRPYYPDARFITIVRDPIGRAISGYLHAKHHPDAWQCAGHLISENQISLAEFIRDDVFARQYAEFVSMHDGQAKTVLGPDYSSELGEEAITKIIRSRYYLVGQTERLELLLVCLHVLADFPLILFNNRLVRKERNSFQPGAEDLAAIQRYSRVDGLLHQCVCREFDRRVKEVWNEDTELLYQEYLAALNSFRLETKGIETVAPVLFALGRGQAAGVSEDGNDRSTSNEANALPGTDRGRNST